jgi:hypothetical protein
MRNDVPAGLQNPFSAKLFFLGAEKAGRIFFKPPGIGKSVTMAQKF